MPANPTGSATKLFAGWKYSNETDFVNSSLPRTNVSVYATWDVKPTVTFNSTINFNAAKVAGTPTINWLDEIEGVGRYVVEIYDSNSVLVESGTTTSRSFNLDKTKYVAGSAYIAKVKVVLAAQWHDEDVESAFASSNFNYSITPQDIYTVSYQMSSNIYQPIQVTEGNVCGYPATNPTKTGYVFLKWVITEGGDVEFDPATVTASCTVYPKWIAKPVAPTTVTYTDSACNISWTAVEGATMYKYKVNGTGEWIETTNTSITVFGLSKGSNSITMMVKVHNNVLDADVWSEESTCNFTVTTLYVGLNVKGVYTFAEVNASNKIATPADPTKAGYMFVKWTTDNNIYTGRVNFDTKTFDKSIILYAMFYERPAQVTNIEYDEINNKITWDAVTDASYYLVKFGNASSYTKVTTNEYTNVNINGNGTYAISVITVMTVDSVGDIRSEANNINKVIELSAQVVYSADNSQIKVIRADGTHVYVYFAGQTYHMQSGGVYAKYAASDFYSFNGGDESIVMSTDLSKVNVDFTLSYTLSGVSYTKTAMIVPQITSISVGGGYAKYLGAIDASSTRFIDKTNAYTVGTKPNTVSYTTKYIVPIDMTYGTAATFADTEVAFDAAFKISTDNGANYVDCNPSTYGITFDKDTESGRYCLSFGQVIQNTMLKLIITPKYLNTNSKNSQDATGAYSKEYTFALNAGINVYTHEQLKEAFANTAITNINIHDDITASLAANQINLDLSPVNFAGCQQASYNYTNGGLKYSGDIYRRDPVSNNTLVLNGNYFLINAESVARIDGTSNYAEQAIINGPNKDVQNVQIAVFKVSGANYKDSRLVVNNLEINGNTELKGADTSEIRIFSGGHNGFMMCEAALEANNVNVHNTTIAYYYVSSMNYNNYSILNKSIADGNWANSVYVHGTTALSIIDSKMLTSSGATVHFEDRSNSDLTAIERNTSPLYLDSDETTRATELRHDPCFAINSGSTISNWITGSEAWFSAWGFGGIMTPKINGDIQPTVSSAMHTSVLKDYGNSIMKFNLSFMFKPLSAQSQIEILVTDAAGNATAKYTYAGDNVDVIGSENANSGSTSTPVNTTTAGSYTTDPRMQSGQLLVPVNGYTDPCFVRQYIGYVDWCAKYQDSGNNTDYANTNSYYDDYVADDGDLLTPELKAQALSWGENVGNYTFAETTAPSAKINGSSFYSVTLSGSQVGAASNSYITIWLEYGYYEVDTTWWHS